MGERTVFECDVTGETYGARNDVLDFELRRHVTPFEIRSRDVCVSEDALDQVEGMVPTGVEYVGIDGNEIVGMCHTYRTGGGGNVTTQWDDRDSVVIEQYEEFFQFIEREVVYGGG